MLEANGKARALPIGTAARGQRSVELSDEGSDDAHAQALVIGIRVEVWREPMSFVTNNELVRALLGLVSHVDLSGTVLRRVGDQFVDQKADGLDPGRWHVALVACNHDRPGEYLGEIAAQATKIGDARGFV